LGSIDRSKLNVAGWGGGPADPDAARRQLETSFSRVGKTVIDLIQVHNMGDLRTQLPILREYKDKGRVRYIGVTTTIERQYDDLVRLLKSEPFISEPWSAMKTTMVFSAMPSLSSLSRSMPRLSSIQR